MLIVGLAAAAGGAKLGEIVTRNDVSALEAVDAPESAPKSAPTTGGSASEAAGTPKPMMSAARQPTRAVRKNEPCQAARGGASARLPRCGERADEVSA